MDIDKLFGEEKISKIMLKLAPPVMISQLIQALYNIVDSIFVGRYSEVGLTALSILYPLQLLMIAFAVGSGVGMNTLISARLGAGRKKDAEECAGVGIPLAIALWLIFAVVCWFALPAYGRMSTDSEEVVNDVVVYGRIITLFGFGLFLEGIGSKILQAVGDMKTPMIAQIVGAIVNIILDPIMIFGLLGFPRMNIAGAAIATVIGQILAALIVLRKSFHHSPEMKKYSDIIRSVYILGAPNILMQSAYTFYILGLNLILATFSDQAVTALGLYYKWQTFFFIPLGAMQTCIVPVLSFNHAAGKQKRCSETLRDSIIFGMALMFVGTMFFELIPVPLLRVFSKDSEVIAIGRIGFRWIGISFIPMVTSLIFPVYFQALGAGLRSSVLTVVRTVVLFVPLGYLFARFGLNRFWLTFISTEVLTSLLGYMFYRKSQRS